MARSIEPFPEYPDSQPAENDAMPPQPARKNRRLFVLSIVFATVVLLAVLAAGGYFIFLQRKHIAPAVQLATSTTQIPAPQPPAPTSAPADATLYTSKGQDLNLTFLYPADWTAMPSSGGNTSDQPITVTSPVDSVVNSSGKSVSGKAVVSIRPGSSQLSELASGTAVVTQDSVQIGYTKPTASQHQYPFITFVRLSGGADSGNGFDEIIITGINKFSKGQNLSPESLGQLDPIITARFYTCNATCDSTSRTALLVTNNEWQNGDLFVHTLALFESLQLH